jgi:hypothetical protein
MAKKQTLEEFKDAMWTAMRERLAKAERELEELNTNAAGGWECAARERDKVCAFVLAFGLTSITQKQQILRAMRKVDRRAAALVQKTFKQKRYHRDVRR